MFTEIWLPGVFYVFNVFNKVTSILNTNCHVNKHFPFALSKRLTDWQRGGVVDIKF